MAGPTKILVDGRVQIGAPLTLVRTLRPAEMKRDVVVRAAGPDRVSPARLRPPPDPGGMGVALDKVDLSLEAGGDDEGDVILEDQGLCQAYGVFGIPGSGKTYLLMHMLRQIIEHRRDEPARRFGALILDPKGALFDDVREIARAAGREDDVVVLNERVLRDRGQGVNVIASYLQADSLGRALAMSAQSAGISSREPYWMNELGTILGAGLELLRLMAVRYRRPATLRDLMALLLGTADDSGAKPVSMLEAVLADARDTIERWSPEEVDRFELAQEVLARYRRTKDHDVLASFIEQSYGIFRRPEFLMFSPRESQEGKDLYDSILDEGRLVLVSISKRNLAISKILCTVVKTLFQQAVITRLERYRAGELANFERPLLFMADEYSDVATELEGQPMGDGLFFSQMRQFGCMGLVATQSVHMLQNSALGETWKGIFANLAAKIFLQLGDHETAEEASKLVGESELRFQSFDRTLAKDGFSQTVRSDLRDKKDLPTSLLLQTLRRGEAVVVGSTDGKSRPVTRFVKIAATRGGV